MPADLGIDLSKPPPPPSQKPPPPPKKKKDETQGVVGAWEEVKEDKSMWRAGQVVPKEPGEPDSDDENAPANDPMIQLKYLTMQRGAWMDEDYERHEKEMVQKPLASSGSGAKMSFPLNRKKASGIRKRDDPEEDARC